MKDRINKLLDLFALERYPQAKNGPFDLVCAIGAKIEVPASWPKRAGYEQKKSLRIFA
jgi:hypothetical protein